MSLGLFLSIHDEMHRKPKEPSPPTSPGAAAIRKVMATAAEEIGGPICEARDPVDLEIRIEIALCSDAATRYSLDFGRAMAEHEAAVDELTSGNLDPRWSETPLAQSVPEVMNLLAEGEAIAAALGSAIAQLLWHPVDRPRARGGRKPVPASRAVARDRLVMSVQASAPVQAMSPFKILASPSLATAVSGAVVAERRARMAFLGIGYLVTNDIRPREWLARGLVTTWVEGMKRYLGLLASGIPGLMVPAAFLEGEYMVDSKAADAELAVLRASDEAHGIVR